MLGWSGKDDKFVPLKLGNFEELCPINEYLKIVENVVPSDEEMNTIFNDINSDLADILTSDFVFKPKYNP